MPVTPKLNQPTVSVCILSYNRPQFLPEAVQSVLCQSLPPSEIIILDNGSDGAVKLSVERFLQMGVAWEGSEIPQSVFWNWERAVAKTASKYLYIMHDDDRLCTGFLAEQIGFLEEHPYVLAVGCDAHIINRDGNRVGKLLHPSRLGPTINLYRSSAELALLYSESSLAFPSMIYRNPYPQKIKGRPEFGKVGDVVFLCELASLGKIAYQNMPLFEYRVHSGQDSAYFPSNEQDLLEDFLVGVASSNPQILRQVTRNIRVRRTNRLLWQADESIRRGAILAALRTVMKLFDPHYVSLKTVVKFVLWRSAYTGKQFVRRMKTAFHPRYYLGRATQSVRELLRGAD